MKLLLPIILLISLVSPAKAEDLNCEILADYYLEYAKPDNDPTKKTFPSTFFLAYVIGFIDGDFVRRYLIPSPVSNRQVAHVVGKWIQAHPEKWHFPYISCVHLSLLETWPNPYN